MYTCTNYKTKKELKQAVERGERVPVFQPNDMFGSVEALPDYTGGITLEGPHYPEAHKWYAQAKVVAGSIVEVR